MDIDRGMIGNLIRVSQAELEEFKEDSSRLEEKLSREGSYQANWFLDLDKSWEGIQYILTGKGKGESSDFIFYQLS